MNKRKLSLIGIALIAIMLFISGCSTNNASQSGNGLEEINTVQGESISSSGTILLKVNPEIAVDYNEQGLVTQITGKNDDGQEIIANYNDFIGKESGLVLEELIALIDEAGYFVEEVEGESRQIILELETGSVLPEENFLEVLAMNVQNAVAHLNAEADVVQEEDLGQNEGDKEKQPEMKIEDVKAEKTAEQSKTQETTKKEAQKANYIGMEKAKSIALNHAGVQAGNVRWDDAEFDIDDGVPHYELEFNVGANEYEYDIHAVSGNIIKFEQDIERKQAPQKPKAQAPATQKPKAQAPAPQKPKAPAPAPAPAKKQPAAPKEITKDEAINIALNHAGLTRSQVVFDDVELDVDDGRKEWEIEFDHGNWEYEYEIDASNGNILDFEKEYDD